MHQEILIMLHSMFAKTELNEAKRRESTNIVHTEKIGEACVNNLLQKTLPIVTNPEFENRLHLWEINPGLSFLQFELGELPFTIEKKYSLDPHNFLTFCCRN